MRTGKAGRPDGRDGELHAHLASIVDSASDAIASVTLDGIVTSWNAGAAVMFGYAVEELIGHPVSIVFPPGQAGELVPILDQIRQGRRVGTYEAQRVRKDGTTVYVSVSVSPLRDDRGTIVGAGVVARDVTERTWAEAERREHDASLHHAERIESLDRLAGAIAADLTDLTSAIMGYAENVAQATTGDAAVHGDLQKIQEATGRAADLATELLVFSRRDPTQPGRVDLNDVLTSIRDFVAARVGGRVELRVSTASGPVAVMADRGQIERVLLNLAENARDAMPEGGTLTFTTSLVSLSKVTEAEWPGAEPGLYAKLSASDTGWGMTAEIMRHVFEPFFTTKQPGQGKGLGLSTVYGVITKAGGGITIESEADMGTTVHVYLPAVQAQAPASPVLISPVHQGHGEIILVVDNQPSVVEIAARILRYGGYCPLEAATHDEALSLMSAHDCRLLLAGTAMSAMADRARKIRPGIRVLWIVGSPSEAMEPTGSGETPFIGKPLTASGLLEKVRTALAGKPAL